jgi:predicted ATPase/class 3 adenylate cyclase
VKPLTRPPTGTVAFLFSDIEGSAIRWDAHRAEMQEAVRRHDELMRAAIEHNGGYVFKTVGDAFCAAFATVHEAVTAALDAQRAIAAAGWNAVGGLRVRMAIHAGVADERDGDYFGPTVNRVARLLAVGHGGQVLLSRAAKELSGELLPAQTELHDLGRHRLRDLSAPEHVFQLHAPDLAADFPSLRSLDALPNNLPLQLTPLIGRDEEIAEIKALLERSRLVTLTGTGGIGKTRTAVQVATDMLHGDGVWFVDLAPLDDATLVPSAIAQAFNVADEGGSRPLIDRVVAALKAKTLLIVLDNCEHVVSAAADAVDRLLHRCPNVRILATSREPLGIAGEESYRMPTLPVPPANETMTAEVLMQYAAAALFVDRAHAAHRTFALTDENAAIVADIVRRLDGIALAIELAAPRIRVLSMNQLEQRLDERLKLLIGGSRTALPRQQTLRATIEWSYNLLSPAEQSLLRRLAIFRGGWTLEATEAICIGQRFSEWNVFDILSALIDKSLVAAETKGKEPRYRLLESTRQFAAERLHEASEGADVAERHCRYFAQAAQRAGEAYWQTDSDLWMAQVRLDLENYRAAIEWGLSGDAYAEAAEIVAGLRWWWTVRARSEGRMLLIRAAATLTDDVPDRIRGLLALTGAPLQNTRAQGANSAAEAAYLLAGGVYGLGRAEALIFQGTAFGREGRIAESLAFFEEALTAARATRAPRLIGWALTQAAYFMCAAGDRGRARALFDEAAVSLRRCNDLWQLASLQANKAELLFAEGDLEGALECAREAEVVYRERGAAGDLSAALLNAAAYLLALTRLDEAWTAARESLELALREDSALAALSLGHLAHIAAGTGNPVPAARLFGYVDAAFAKSGNVREPTEQQGYDRALELIRATLPEDRIRALMTEGAAMERAAAVAEAMAIPQPHAS